MIRKFLELSTAHVTPITMKRCSEDDERIVAYPYKYGAWVWVPDDPSDPMNMLWEYPPELHQLIKYAREKGCDWIRLDGDADEDPRMPTFDWTAFHTWPTEPTDEDAIAGLKHLRSETE